ncbi:MAG: trimethylamine methyltransferase family protein [Promethearchaeota archaeon]
MTLRPKLELLSEADIQRIHEESLALLEDAGMAIHNEEALTLLAQAGCSVDQGKLRAFIPASLVEEQLRKAPQSITLYSRDGEPALQLESNKVHFNPGSAATHLLDRKTGERRHPRVSDVVEFARMVDALSNIDAQSTAVIPADVPSIIADRYRLYLVLQNSTKPVITGTFALDAFDDMRRMLEVIAGSSKKLRDKPLAIFDACPSAPLNWSKLTVHDLLCCAKAGIPVETISMPQLGATGPITLAGSLVLHNAESLSGLVLAQLTSPGAPVIYGGSPTAVDMRYGTARLGAIESIMLTCAYAQMAKHYGLPTHGYLGLSDAKLPADSQSGFEATTGLILGALMGINNIAGVGMLCFESTQSFEKLLLDEVICGMAKRMTEGILVTDETLASEALREVSMKGGDFLRLRHTLTWFRREHFLPGDLVDRQPYEAWKQQGAPDSQARARKQIASILESHQPVPLTSEQKQGLDEIVNDFTKRHKLDPSKLPS